MAKKYQTAEAWMQKNAGDGSIPAASSTGRYQTAEEWMQKNPLPSKSGGIHDKTVYAWTQRYNNVMNRVSDYDRKRNGGFTRDASGGFSGEIESLISGYNSVKDKGWENGINPQKYLTNLLKLRDYVSEVNQQFSQFESQEDYDQYVSYQKDREEKKNLDIASYERELSALEKALEDYDPAIDWTDTNARKQVSQEIEDRKAEISRRKQYLNQAKQIQKNAQMASVADPESSGYDKDFSSMSQYGIGSDDQQYEYINNQNGMRDRIKEENRSYGSNRFAETDFEEKGYDYLTEDEVAVYNYYYARDGKEKAQEYLDTMQEELNRRKAGAYYQNMEGNTPMELAFGFAAGLDQFSSGVKSLFNTEDDYIPYSAKQIASGMAREDLADVGIKTPDWLGGASLGQIGYDAITTTTNMAPSILASMAVGMVNPIAGEIVGTGLMGASAAGNAYQEMLNSGYDKKQARTYSALVGASEAGLQYLLGGIGKLGGKVSGNAVKRMIDGIDSAFIRAAVNFGGNMASEGLEEGLQEILTPWFQNLVLYANEDVNWSEVAYSSLLGALTAGVMEGPGDVYQAVNTYRSGKQNVPEAAAGTKADSPVGKIGEKVETVDSVMPEKQAGMQDTGKQETIPAPETAVQQDMGVETETQSQEPVTLESLSQKYGSYAQAMQKNYLPGQDVEGYDRAFQIAYDMGKSGLNKDAMSRVEALSSLKNSQREIAYEIGQAAAQAQAKAQSEANAKAANENTGWHRGVVRGEGVKIADLTKTFNDPQRKAYSVLSTIAEATGIDIVLYKSGENSNGEFEGAQGRFQWNSNAIYIDVNAGLRYSKDVGSVAKYAMVRTFGHEFTHFIEKWNPERYNEFRSAVFSTMENPEDLIERKLSQDSTGKMTYDDASREVVAEAMTDILEDSNFLQELAKKQPSVMQVLKDKISEYLENLKSYFRSLAKNGSPEAKQLKKEVGDSISYLEDIVKQFDTIAVEAVENYQKTVAEDKSETVSEKEKVDSNLEKASATESKSEENGSMQQEGVPNNSEPDSDGTASEPAANDKTEPSFAEFFWNATQEERNEVVAAMEENMGGFTRMYPTEKPSQESVEPVVETSVEPVVETSVEAPASSQYDGFSITPNTERGTLEIRFDSKPGEEVRDILKANKFRWSSKNKLWYGKADPDAISNAILEKMGTAEIPENLPQTDTAQSSQVQNITEEENNNGSEDDTVRSDVTEGSFDARLWDILERKQNFIDQIMNGENVGREAEDTGEVTLSAAEVKALASGSPLIMEQVQLDTDIKKLESLYRAYNSAKAEANMRKIADMGAIQTMTRETENVRKDISARTDDYQDGKFSMVIGKKTFTDKKEAGTALMAAAMKKANFNDFVQIGTFAGFPMKVIKTEEGIRGVLAGSQKYNFKTYPGNTTYMVNQIVSVIDGLENRVDNLAASIESTRADMAEQEAILSAPFAKQAELDQKRARYQEVMDLLNPKQEQILDEDEGKVQYQGREQEDTPYSYDWFVSKPDMAVTTVTGTVPNSRADVVYYAKQNAAKIGKVNPQNGSVSVYVNDIGTDVLVGTDGLKHGLRRIRDAQNDPNYIVTMKAGEILQNSIKINEANPKKENATGSYVLIGICRNVNGDTYVVRSIVNHFTNELASMDVLYAINAKKELAAAQPPRSTAKPLSVTSSTISISDLLDIVNQNFPDILPESVLKHYGYSARPDGDFGENVLYQQRTETLTDREVLSMAAEEVQGNGNLSAAESDALQIFRDRLSKLDELQSERRSLGREYKELQFGENVDRAKAAETLEKMRNLDSQIQEADNKVLAAETAPILKQVLPKARKIVEQTQKAKDDATLQRWRDRRNNAASIKKYRDRISKDVRDMTDWIISPSNKADLRHVPDALKNTVIPFLTSIDFTSKRQLNGGAATKADEAFLKRLNALESCLKGNIDETGLYSGYNDLPPDFMKRLQGFIKTAQDIVNHGNGQFVINQMTAQELKELSGIVTVLKKHIQNFNRFHANAVYSHVYDAGDATIQELNQYQDAKSRGKAGEGMNNFIFWQQIRPAYAFERFGKGGKAIYDGLRRGQAKLAFNTREIVDFSQKAYTEKEVRDWEKEVKTVKIGEETVQMKVSQIMSLYELLKRDHARGHIFGQGIRFATFTADGKKISDTGHIISPEDANRIIGELTPRQIAVADALQEFMQRKGGEWGNFVSMKRFGEAQFGEEHYFPINSDGRHLDVNADENPSAASLYALLNMGFTKKLQEKANNRLVVYSIFDVFSNHMASMAQYNAMALPVLDALKWFNYQQKEDVVTNVDGEDRIIHEVKDSVRDQLDRVFGVPEETRPGSGKRGYAENFIVGVLKAFNGTETQGISSDTPGLNSLRHYNMAQVAYNLRVVVQQPLAITRAAMLIDYGSIIRGMKLSPAAIQRNIQQMQKYSGIAAWKDLGFYDTNISRGLTDIIKHNETFRDKLGNVGMFGAEKADQMTWAAIWSACKEEVSRKHGIQPGSEVFYEAVTSLFEEVIYKTQVVDSVLTKNEFLRSKGFFARATGSFMSEPTTTASMLADAFDKYRMDLQRNDFTPRQAWEKNWRNIGRTAYVYTVSAVILAAVQAVADGLRDDDKYEKYTDKWQEAFIGNAIDELVPFNKLPIISDVYELSKELLRAVGVDTYGNSPTSVLMQWYDSLVKGTEIIYKKITGDENNRYTWYGGAYKLLQAVSGMTGLPMAAATREIVTAWNNTVGKMAPSYLVRTYEQDPKLEIKYSFQDGYLTELEAQNALVRDAGFTAEEAAQKVSVMAFRKAYPEYADEQLFSEASVQKYLEYCKPNGIEPGICFDILAFSKNAEADVDKKGNPISGSKKKKILAYIHRQNLTRAQKDAIYKMFD